VGPDGTTQYIVTCGADAGWDTCYRRAQHVCPTGYDTLSKDARSEHNSLRIACSDQPRHELREYDVAQGNAQSEVPVEASLSRDTPAEVVETIRGYCEAGNIEACARLGSLYARGSPALYTARDANTVARFIKYACDRHDAKACAALLEMNQPGWVKEPEEPAQRPADSPSTEPQQAPPTSVRVWPGWAGRPRPAKPTSLPTKSELRATELYRRARPSVYWVRVGGSKLQVQGGAVAVSAHFLLTNCHLFETPGPIVVGQQEEAGTVTLFAADPKRDRCWLYSRLLQFEPVSGVRSFESLVVGEPVYSIGAPKGLEATLGPGVVSGKRDVKVIQTNAPISHGSSGGALFDAFGNLVGITTFSRVESQALNFCLSTDIYWE